MRAQISKALQRWGKQPAAEIDAAADRLHDEATAASKLRGYLRNPFVAALTIEYTRNRGEFVMVLTMALFLISTTVNVQEFVAGDSTVGAYRFAAYFVEPAITVGWITLMWMEQVARHYGEVADRWVRSGRWAALAVTYTFNTWLSWESGVWRDIITHSAIPFLVFCFAEALISIRHSMTRAAENAEQGIGANRIWPGAPSPETPEIPWAVPPAPPATESIPEVPDKQTEEQTDTEDTEESSTVVPLRPIKGYLKNERLPQVLRELREQGRERDSITTTEIDAALPASKYASRKMINDAWSAIEDEEADDGAVSS